MDLETRWNLAVNWIPPKRLRYYLGTVLLTVGVLGSIGVWASLMTLGSIILVSYVLDDEDDETASPATNNDNKEAEG